MKKIIYIFSFLWVASFAFGQGQLNITDPSYSPSNPVDCNNFSDHTAFNFFDDGGSSADYGPNRNDVLTVCPDISSGLPKIRASFGGMGAVWDVHPSDTLYVYDGPNANSPLIGAYNNGNAPNGFEAVASWANTSGCLTFVFVSDGTNQGEGWAANVICFSPPQDIILNLEAFINGTPGNDLFPLDTGYVDLCQGDSVLFVAKLQFPYSSEITGSGYSQNLNNVSFLWAFSDGSVGPDNDSVWFTPPTTSGYFVNLTVTDTYPQNVFGKAKVRVSTTPNFTGTGSLKDTVCFNQLNELLGGVTASDTVGVDVPQNNFQIGGNFAGLTFLPDGSNNEYTTSVHMSGFPPGATVSSASDITQVCVNMEHSFMGDLEMWLECPNGTTVTIFDAYPGGSIPGGFSPGGIFLGEPNDQTNGGEPPGNGYNYCFSSTINNWGAFAQTYMTNTIPTPPTAPSSGNTMNPNGIYAPEQSFANFAGCPLNGDWTIHVKDNWAIDDGWIFEWGIYFDPSLYPDNETYQNVIDQAFWSPDPTIVSGAFGDTLIITKPNATGYHSYTFNVVDDFGCAYDTIVQVFVLDTIINGMALDTSLFCYSDSIPLWVKATGTNPPFSFFWNTGDTSSVIIQEAMQNGTYNFTVTITDACGNSIEETASITMNQTLTIESLIQNPADCGLQNGSVVAMPDGITGTPHHTWSGPGTETPNQTSASAWPDLGPGWYYYTITDNVCTMTDSIFLEQNPPPEAHIDADPTSGMSPLTVTFINNSDPASNYIWDFGVGGDTSVIIVHDLSSQEMTYIDNGIYTVYLVVQEGGCEDIDSVLINVVLPPEYDMPNIFTPNGDGQNDFFTINAKHISALEVVILNRWGNIVFESQDLDFKWNGQVNNNGAKVADGVYFYKFTLIDLVGNEIQEHGFVHVVDND